MPKIVKIESIDSGEKDLFCVDSLEPEHARFIVDENGIIIEDWNGHGYENRHIKDALKNFDIDQVIGWDRDLEDECSLKVEFDDGTIFNGEEEKALKYAGII